MTIEKRRSKSSRRVGIITGAGPMAGALLFEKIIQLTQTDYSCQDDRDFPFISLVSYPFAEMLKGNIDANLLKFQMAECFQMFIDQGVSLAAIACNTLHAFCPPIPPQIEFLHLIRETATHLEKEVTGDLLVLSSTTSKNNHLYNRCLYPKRDLQTKLDQMIDRILGGSQLETESRRLASWLNEYPTATIVLGCTEFSLLNERTPLFDAGLDKRFTLCDPNLIIAKQITDKCYEQSIPRINS